MRAVLARPMERGEVMETTIVGHDDFSEVIRTDFDNGAVMYSRLTPCCRATAKGLEDGVGCRACYRLIDPKYGEVLSEEQVKRIA